MISKIASTLGIDKESKTLFKNSSWVFISNFIGIALAFLRSVAIARGLGAETFGSYTLVVAFVGLIQEFLNLNLGTALIKFGAGYHHEQRIDKLAALVKSFLKICGVTAIVSVAVVVLLSLGFYDKFINKPGLEYFVILYAVASSTKYFNSISNGLLRLYYRFRMNSFIQIVMDIVETALVIAAIFIYRDNLQAFFVTVIVAAFLNGLICNVMAYWELRREFLHHFYSNVHLVNEEIKAIRKFVLGNSLGNSLKSLMSQGDVLLLGAMAGPAQVAYYAVAKKLGYAVLVLTDPLMTSIFPQFSKLLASKKFLETKTMLKKITTTALIPAAVFMIPAYFLSGWVITFVFGKEYAEAGLPFFWLLAGAVFGAITFWTLPLVQSLGLVGLRLKIYVLAIVIGTGIAITLIPEWKATGMAVALLCANIIINVLFIIKSFDKMKHIESSVI